jgi:hypothetical protein
MLTRRLLCASGLALAGGGAVAQTPALRLSSPRAAHNVLAMRDGSVLFIGGCVEASCETGPASASVDRYDPQTRRVSRIGRLLGSRMQAAVAELPDGKVLVAGGWSGGKTASLERFDPRRGQSERIGELSAAQVCAAIALSGGRLLIMGDRTIDVVDTRTLAIRRLSATSPWLDSSTATLLGDGRILVAGGRVTGQPRAEAWLVNAADGRAMPTGELSTPRRKHAAVLLGDGRVLMVGGSGANDRQNKYRGLEVYNPATGRFSRVGETIEARFKIPDAAVKLADGRVLVAGGADYPELIDPSTWKVRRVNFALDAMLNFSTAVALADGGVLVAGGYSERTINPTDRVWIIPKALLV